MSTFATSFQLTCKVHLTESLDDDWERDFDVELTEEDMKAADEIAKKLNLSATDYTKLAGELVGKP